MGLPCVFAEGCSETATEGKARSARDRQGEAEAEAERGRQFMGSGSERGRTCHVSYDAATRE
jgi:hypothetical protein